MLSKGDKSRNVASFLYSGKMEYLSSIVFHTVILKMLLKEAKSRNVASFLYSGIMENLSSIVFHSVIQIMLSRETKSRNVASFLYRIQNWEYVSSTLFHTVMPKCFQKGPNQEMWLRFYIVEQWSMYHR